MNQGIIAGIALLVAIPVVFHFFSKNSPARAAFLSMAFAAMFLPEGAAYDFPLVPPFDKHTLPITVVILILFFAHEERVRFARPIQTTAFLLILTAVGAVGVSVTNREALVYGGQVSWVETVTYLPPLSFRDSISVFVQDVQHTFLPFMVGMIVIRSRKELRDVLVLLMMAGFVYSFFALYEVRMSPQLHLKTYGYVFMAFDQAVRWGGYRPQIYMSHGLVVAFFMALTVFATALVRRLCIPNGKFSARWLLPYLVVILVLCKSTGAILYAVLFLPVILLGSRKLIMRVTLFFTLLTMSYPVTRALGIFPTEWVLNQAAQISLERADSLGFRFDNEDILLERAAEKPIFGWGGFGRGRVYDPMTGRDLSVTDGAWIIRLTTTGAIGFFVYFGILSWAVYRASRIPWRNFSKSDQLLVAGFSFIVALCLIEDIPNAIGFRLHFFLAGGLFTVARVMSDPMLTARYWAPAWTGAAPPQGAQPYR
ncbi:MAG: hypothetical protein HC923_00800 [Myxococcales bacterium]|nr:hypothetical protein [Myxococcales bacterium]